LLRRDEGFDESDEGDDLEETEDTERRHVLGSEEGEEADEGDLHRGEGSDGVEGRVGDVEARGVTAHEEEDEHMEGKHVGDEGVSTCDRTSQLRMRKGGRKEENAPHAATM
jgi:hypothetical protein